MYVAHHAHRDMGAVCEWVLLQDRPAELGAGDVRAALDQLMRFDDSAMVAGAVEASRGLLSIWELEERTRSSVYSTAQTVVWPWSDPGVAASAKQGYTQGAPPDLDLGWLLSGSNTVYLCLPIEDQCRLAPAFGGLLNDLVNQAYRQVARTGKPLDPPLLVVIDEAGNTPLRSLPEYASTLAGIGVLLVTIWQSLAQIEAALLRAPSRHHPHEPPDQVLLRRAVGPDDAALRRPGPGRGRGRHPLPLGGRAVGERVGPVLHHPSLPRARAHAPPDAPGRRAAPARDPSRQPMSAAGPSTRTGSSHAEPATRSYATRTATDESAPHPGGRAGGVMTTM